MSGVASLNLYRVAARSVRTLNEISRHIAAAGFWEKDEPIETDLARTVKQLFDLLAWSDGSLDGKESDLLEHLMHTEKIFVESLRQFYVFQPVDPTASVVPKFLEAAIAYDRKTPDALTGIIINALETVGYSIIAVNGKVLEVEASELKLYINGLRMNAELLSKG